MTTARINNHKNKGDFIIVGFNPNSLIIDKKNIKIKLFAAIYYDQNNIDTICQLIDFIDRNKQDIVSFTYKNICVVGHLSKHHIDYTLFDTNSHPIRAKVNIEIEEE